MNILVCDDDQYYVDKVVGYLKGCESEFIDHSIKGLSDGHQIMVDIKINKYDVAFLDVKMGDVNGLDVARILLNSNPYCIIVLVTDYYQYISNAFDLRVFNFLHKSILEKEFRVTYYKILAEYQKRHSECVFNTSKGKQIFNPFDIMYIETYYNSLKIVTVDGSFYSNVKNGKYIKKTLEPFDFMQIHQSFFVNFHHVKRVKNDYAILKNGEDLPISPGKKQEILEAFNKFMIRG